jgi:hypothetical protein
METGIGLGGVVAGYSYNNNPENFIISFSISGILAFAAVAYLIFYQLNKRKKPT